MDFKPDQLPKKEPSILDAMVLKSDFLEKLPNTEKIVYDMKEAVISGKTEASELIREHNLLEKIQGTNISFLDQETVQTYLKVLKFQNNSEYTKYNELDRVGGMYDPATKKIGILVNPLEIVESSNFAQAKVLTIGVHEILHSIAQNIKITWLNEAVTERLTQGLMRDILSSSKEWNETFSNLTEQETDQLSFGSYSQERDQLYNLSEEILDSCSMYKDLPKGGYKERMKAESIIFTQNFGTSYFSGDTSIFEKNIKELGYSSISELEQLDPEASV